MYVRIFIYFLKVKDFILRKIYNFYLYFFEKYLNIKIKCKKSITDNLLRDFLIQLLDTFFVFYSFTE